MNGDTLADWQNLQNLWGRKCENKKAPVNWCFFDLLKSSIIIEYVY